MKVEIELFSWVLIRRSGIGDIDAPHLLMEHPVFLETDNDRAYRDAQYESRVELEISELLGLLDNHGFTESLAHSNLDLVDRLRKQLDNPPPQNKRQRRAQLLARRTAARYATRAAAKTSPFGYFGTVGLRSVSKDGVEQVIQPRTIARLNTDVIIHFLTLAESLLLKSSVLQLEVVPSAYFKEGWIYFYAVIDDKPTIRRLRWNRALGNLIELLPPLDMADGSLSGVCMTRIRDTRQVSDVVVEKVRNMGLIALRAPSSLLDGSGKDGLEHLVRIQEALAYKQSIFEFSSIRRIQDVLSGTSSRSSQLHEIQRQLLRMEANLRRIIGVSPVSGEVSRSGVRRRFFQKNLNPGEDSGREPMEDLSLASIPVDCQQPDEAKLSWKKQHLALPVATENLIYEDVSVGECDGPPRERYAEAAREAAPYVQLLRLIKHDLELKSSLFRFFKDGIPKFVPVMEAYRTWLQSEPEASEAPDVMRSVNRILGKAIVIRSVDDYQVQLSVDLQAVLCGERDINFEFSMVGQWSRCEETPRLEFVANHFIPGCARYLSRFLPLFPKKVTKEIVEWRSNQRAGSVEAEIVDTDIYSANVHPTLTKYQIVVNSAYGDFEAAEPIAVADLAVRFCQKRKAFEFKSLSTGLLVRPVDYGFMGVAKRQGLTQFLLRLAAQGGYPESEVLGVLRRTFLRRVGEGVTFVPRLSLSNGFTISRARWVLENTRPLLKRKREPQSVHYDRVLHLLSRHSVPMLVYVTEHEEYASEFGHKPQYINLTSPTGMELLLSVVRKADGGVLVLEEAFPTGCSSWDEGGVRSEDYFGARARIIG